LGLAALVKAAASAALPALLKMIVRGLEAIVRGLEALSAGDHPPELAAFA
jgi:hypothetical protein